MERETKMIARPGLATMMVIAWVLSGCSGPGTVANTQSDSSSTSTTSPSTPTAPPTAAQLILQGSPPTSVTAGSLYSFQPTVSSGATGVTFSINRKPAWASFNSSTGALSGTPSVGNVGTTANIMIVASDNSATASIGPFAIAVDAPGSAPPATGTGTATLTWVAPKLNTDGTILNNLAGYRIYYGTDANALNQEIDVAGATTTSYVVNGLAAGTYYFAVSAYSSAGIQSDDSNEGSKAI
jgi:hypothetical protein